MNRNKTNNKRLIILLLAVCLLPGIALATNTHINITIEEIVHQNVSFARNFELMAETESIFIEGVVTIHNPGLETVSDLYITIGDIGNLNSSFSHFAGRFGTQLIFPGIEITEQITGTVPINTPQALPFDIDEDGQTDFFWYNNTHLIFNISSEFALHTFAFPSPLNTNPTLNFNNIVITSFAQDNEYNQDWDFGSFSLTGSASGAPLNFDSLTFSITDFDRDYVVLHVPELRSGQQSIFTYNISSTFVNPPLQIQPTYTNPEFNTKVLAGEPFGVRLQVSNNVTVGALEAVNITLQAESVNMSQGAVFELFNFTLTNLNTTSGDFANVNQVNDHLWYWLPNGGTIGVAESFFIDFQIVAPDTVPTSDTYLALSQFLSYRINAAGSELRLKSVRGRAGVVFNETKQIVRPQDAEQNRNATWRTEPKVGTNNNITFTLERVTMWVTEVLDPNQQYPNLRRDYFPEFDIDLDTTWIGEAWMFNFSDGSNAANPPPIVWMRPFWIIKNTGNQIVNSSFTVNGTDMYLNYIYVVNGYWLEIQKEVIDVAESQYDIRTRVINRGNGHTPQNMTVTIYDFIPEGFDAFNFVPNYGASEAVSGEFTGRAYFWDVGLRTDLQTSFSPRGSLDGLDTFFINYTVNGSGDFRVSDLYIVGLDPRLVDGGNSFEGVAIISAIASTSRELLYLAIVFFLIGINLANFMMTSRIHRKLQ